jgi:predicted ATP-dependent endonuclease of OLD family
MGDNFNSKKFLIELKSIYSYVYIPVEINSESFTKIETEEMQKVFNKEIKDEILKSIKEKEINIINTNLNKFVQDIEIKLNNKYFYDTGDTGTKTLTRTSVLETVLEMYFKKRVLMKGNRNEKTASKKMSELSAGEKREALINLIYVFLEKPEIRDKIVIIGIDEPENSLHTSLCYEQFEKLKKISENVQVLITTHWYGFLPIVDKGIVHFLKTNEDEIIFEEKIDLYLYPYQTKKIPKDFTLKSTNDLVQSIYHSLKAKECYNWLICEGTSDQIYIEYFLKDLVKNKKLNIIPVGGCELVKKFFKFLSLPIEENINDETKGKIFCLTDTDSDLRKGDITQNEQLKKKLILKRFSKNESEFETELVKFENEINQNSIDIESSLNPTIYIETLKTLTTEEKFNIDESKIKNINGNTTKENLRNLDIEEFFESEIIKNEFAKKYVKIMDEMVNSNEYIPKWVNEIKTFFK